MKTYTSKTLERKRKSKKIRFVSREDAIKKTNDLKIKLKLVQKKLQSVYFTKECQFCGQNFKVLLHAETWGGYNGKWKKQGKSYCNVSCRNGEYRKRIWERENEKLMKEQKE